jgi:predicted aspartyl protease
MPGGSASISAGAAGMTSTANGQVVVTRIQLDTVRIGGMTLHNVEAVCPQPRCRLPCSA